MATYCVEVKEVHTQTIRVKAKNAQQALEKAKEFMASGDIDYSDLQYSHTLEPDTWGIYLEKGQSDD